MRGEKPRVVVGLTFSSARLAFDSRAAVGKWRPREYCLGKRVTPGGCLHS
jgi:hypothetical protein